MKNYVMPREKPKQQLLEDVTALLEQNISITEIAERLNIPRYSIYNWRSLGYVPIPHVKKNHSYQPPEILSSELDVESLLDRAEKRFDRLHKKKESITWFPYKMKQAGPFGLCFFGDPHIGDEGCNVKLLREHINIVNNTDGLYGIGMGDYTNNWAGRLAQNMAPLEETTRPQTWKLVDWFFKSVDWFLLIKGNHDVWSGNDDVLEFMYKGAVPIQDWQSKFKVVCPNKREFKIWVAHDFHGHSMYNPLHGPMKKGKFTGQADVYVAGHKHNWALYHVEDADNKKTYWASRARGYKYFDNYANVLGIEEQQHGASVVAIFDPDVEGPASIQMFADVKESAEYLTWKRSKLK